AAAAEPAASVSAKQALAAPALDGTKEVRVLGRETPIASEIRSLKNLFSVRDPGEVRAQAVGSSERASTPLGWSTPEVTPQRSFGPPAPPQKPEGPKRGGFLGLNVASSIFIAALLVEQVGVEAWAAAWSKWVQAGYGMDAFAMLTTVSMFTSLAAGFAGGWLGDRIGQKWTYVGTTALSAALAAGILLWCGPGGSVAMLIGLSAIRTLSATSGRTVEQTIPIALTDGDPEKLQRYNSVSQFILEIAGIAVPLMIGTLLGQFGSVGTMWFHPITAAAAAAMVFFLVKIPESKPAALTLDAPAENPAPKDPRVLKVASMAYPVFVLLNMMLYGILAIAYGNFIFPGADQVAQAAAAGLAGKIVGLYSLGSLMSALVLTGLLDKVWAWIKGKLGRPEAPQAPKELDPSAELKATAKWTLWSAVGLLGFVPFIWTNPTMAAAAMIPFGFTNIMGQLRLLSLIQANLPPEKKGKVMGTIRTVSTLLATGGIWGFTQLVKHFPASQMPYWILLGALAVVGAYYAWIALKLKKL
ncbi:MAG: MFS transporter, partial [Elusimicrobia bacterium]|nr:MFS transporter [Elusimicrobiota bacterium]